jgi:hypothetical protein
VPARQWNWARNTRDTQALPPHAGTNIKLDCGRSRTNASPPSRPLSQALGKMFKIGPVVKGLDGIQEVVAILLLFF